MKININFGSIIRSVAPISMCSNYHRHIRLIVAIIVQCAGDGRVSGPQLPGSSFGASLQLAAMRTSGLVACSLLQCALVTAGVSPEASAAVMEAMDVLRRCGFTCGRGPAV
jgi:hypothetical protein